MKWHAIMQARHLERFARFLEEHPGFWPELVGENALVCGFHVGGCFLTIRDMERLVMGETQLKTQLALRPAPQAQK